MLAWGSEPQDMSVEPFPHCSLLATGRGSYQGQTGVDSSSRSIAWEVSHRPHIPGLLALLGVLRASCLEGQEFTEEKVLAWVASSVWHSLPLSRTLVEGRRDQKAGKLGLVV